MYICTNIHMCIYTQMFVTLYITIYFSVTVIYICLCYIPNAHILGTNGGI